MEKPRIKQLGNYVESKRKNSSNGRVYDPTGIAPTLCTCVGGGQIVPSIIVTTKQRDERNSED